MKYAAVEASEAEHCFPSCFQAGKEKKEGKMFWDAKSQAEAGRIRVPGMHAPTAVMSALTLVVSTRLL